MYKSARFQQILVYHKFSSMCKAGDSMYKANEQAAKNLSCDMGD